MKGLHPGHRGFLFAMRYNIYINQTKAIEWNLSLTEAAIFAYLYELPSWAEKNIQNSNEGIWFFCAKTKIIKEFPLITDKINTIYKVLKSLQEKGLIKVKFEFGKDWIQLTEKSKEYNYSEGSEKNPSNPGKKSELGSEKNPTYYNSISDYNTNDHVAGVPASQKTIADKKIQFIKLLIDWVKKNNGKYPKLMYVDFVKYWTEKSFNTKKEKLRFEDQKFFDIGRRLSTWFKNCSDFTIAGYWEKESKVDPLNVILATLL